jgi:LAS superfamily LD-carboxypeptidase LdcB
MKRLFPDISQNKNAAMIGGIAIFVIVAGLAGWQLYIERAESRRLAKSLSETKAFLTASVQENALQRNIVADLSDSLQIQEKQLETLLNRINGISGTVGTLDKLSKLDSRLLQKYSKVYFLNENYAPASLAVIDQKYASQQSRTYSFLEPAYPYLSRMLDAAAVQGIPILAGSSYRSFAEQTSLKAQYKVTYGSGANRFSADQGYSEHQLGTTADFTTPTLAGSLSGFDADPAYQWMLEHAHEYGFVLSYPKGNVYYVFEPWHWRFVGVNLASKLHRDNLHFYDMDQRDIDKYLITIFD